MPNEFLKKPPKLGNGPKMAPSILEPSRLRELLEGIVDVPMGALGIGPDSKMNRVGAMLGSAFPMGRFSGMKLGKANFPHQAQMGMGMSPSNGIYDDAGRFLGAGNKVDNVYNAHVRSSVGKGDPRMVTKIESPETSFVNRGKAGIEPTPEQVNELLKKYGGQSKK